MSTLTPIAFFTYNRPQHAERALTALSQCMHLDECCLHIFCDGPSGPEQNTAVAETRAVAQAWGKRWVQPVYISEQTENLGLARSIVAGVTRLCAEYGRVIVMEDDLVVSPAFIDYMLRGLNRYQATASVYQIAGYMFRVAQPRKPDAFFLPFITTWGWATWQRAWQIFDWQATGAIEMLSDPAVRRSFDLDDPSARFSTMLSQRLAGENDSWGILWQYAVFKAAGLALFPRESLVWNGGFDGTGRHSGSAPKMPQPDLTQVAKAGLSPDWQWPLCVTTDEPAFKRVKVFQRTRGRARIRVWWAWLRERLRQSG